MARILFRSWFALWPLFLAIGLQMVDLFGFGHFVNLFWGFFYGLGLWFTGLLGRNSVFSRSNIFGVLAWPMVLSVLLYWASGWLWQRTAPRGRWIAAGLLFLTGFIAIDLASAYRPPFNSAPIYFTEFATIW